MAARASRVRYCAMTARIQPSVEAGVHEEKVQVRDEGDEHRRDPVPKPCPDRSQTAPRLDALEAQEYNIPRGACVILHPR
jgi:hypothetical protein